MVVVVYLRIKLCFDFLFIKIRIKEIYLSVFYYDKQTQNKFYFFYPFKRILFFIIKSLKKIIYKLLNVNFFKISSTQTMRISLLEFIENLILLFNNLYINVEKF